VEVSHFGFLGKDFAVETGEVGDGGFEGFGFGFEGGGGVMVSINLLGGLVMGYHRTEGTNSVVCC
jgi:hypothetical protein